ncbi:helix-turn-helix domain-containing protein [Paenibacillus rhizoplanae]
MFDMLKVGRNIVRLRGMAGLTQMGLADKLGISYQAVSNWERGASMPDISKLPQLAEIFDVGIDEILGEGQGQGSRMIESVLGHGGTDYFQRGKERLKSSQTLRQFFIMSRLVKHLSM